ncbi:MAG: crossover junction endodeoxyribonuclease RuvC [Planctomycetota bacterium]|jgi:crossover junction endodeoxyribonuclease RuvC
MRSSNPKQTAPPAGLGTPDTNTWPIIMGVDPGTLVLGFGLIVIAPSGPRLLTAGVLRSAQRNSIAVRLATIREGIDDLIVQFKPTVLAIETAFAAQNVRSALRIGEGRGVVLSCGGAAKLEIHEFAPKEIKKAVTGSGAASKEQVAALVARTLGAEDLGVGLDATDALAAALTYHFRSRTAAFTAVPVAPRRGPK